ncbi:MAG TPA: phospholipid carrier-dependent glycosyltransferase, partial [Bdellovibrionota bacterium]|nr:phospholipid carrier-dependent glycosyltransferase [Bdellovibrionota bacterium]
MPFHRRQLITAGAIFLLGIVLFGLGIQFPKGHDFDEFHQVPEAKELLDGRLERPIAQPPLSRYLVAASIAADADRPFGWRWIGVVFGGLALAGIYFWALALFHENQTALWAVGLAAVNGLLYVQSRIAMPDTFLITFLVWALALFTLFWSPGLSRRRARRLLTGSGILFGLALATKWSALAPWFTCLGLFGMVRLLQRWEARFGHASPWHERMPGHRDWYSPSLWSNLKDRVFWIHLGLIPMGVYVLSFLPLFLLKSSNVTLGDFWSLQMDILNTHLQPKPGHPYASAWYEWPLMLKPIWYAFDKEGAGQAWVRGVVLLGNPLVLWPGLAAVAFSAWAWVRHRSQSGFLITILFLCLWMTWVVIPAKGTFFYHYIPAALVLGLGLTYAGHAVS